MNKNAGIGIAISVLFFASGCNPLSDARPDAVWLNGTWEKTFDEDGAPSDKITFRGDGSWISYGPDGQEMTLPYHLDSGDIYLTILSDKPGNGPVALVLRPSHDHAKLTFTSPRTGKNATYERADRSRR